MKSPLIQIDILSIYKNSFGDQVPLPKRMALCTPDTFAAITNIAVELKKLGGRLILSDLFRSYYMQAQSHHDFVSGKKKAFSPPPGGSFHEAGRGFDLDLSSIEIPLAEFWKLAASFGVVPIIKKPSANVSEAWHFDCRGSHQMVYDYYANKKGTNFPPYTAAAASAIISIGVHVDAFGNAQQEAAIQSCLIRLGQEIGNIDGQIGHRSQLGLEKVGVNYDPSNLISVLTQVENIVQQKFATEFRMPDAVKGLKNILS